MKTKEEYKQLTGILPKLSEEELEEVSGGDFDHLFEKIQEISKEIHKDVKPATKIIVPGVTTLDEVLLRDVNADEHNK